MYQTFISRHHSNFFSDKLVLTSVTPASLAPVLQTPKATSSTLYFFFSSGRRHTSCSRDWSSDVCSSDLLSALALQSPSDRDRTVEGEPGAARQRTRPRGVCRLSRRSTEDVPDRHRSVDAPVRRGIAINRNGRHRHPTTPRAIRLGHVEGLEAKSRPSFRPIRDAGLPRHPVQPSSGPHLCGSQPARGTRSLYR